MSDDVSTNPTTNRPFADILDARLGRRTVLGGTLATAALTFFGSGPALAEARPAGTSSRGPDGNRPERRLLDFTAVPLSTANEVHVPAGYAATAFLPWGTAILPGTADGYPTSAEDQERKIGLGHDGMWFFPTRADGTRGVLCLNQEYGTHAHVSNGLRAAGVTMAQDSPEFVRLSQAVHGVSVVEIEKVAGEWRVVKGRLNRRITANTPMVVSGPVAGSPLLENAAGNPVAGTINNCANGKTPWGTYLTCEENFHGYFGATRAGWTATAEQARYGFRATSGYGWFRHDARFDLSDPAYANEHNRFGWIVEIDPMDPTSTPVKRTALGRFKHENCEVVEGRGKRIVAYMGDDQANDYVYKFVSETNWRSMQARGMSPLDRGTLYVARFDDDGTGRWLPLTMDDPRLAARFSGIDDLLVNTRIAADIVGATPMDRPEWAAAHPGTGEVFITMTNNSGRTVANGPNPRTPNRDGHIVKIIDRDQHVGTAFRWDIFVLSGPATDPSSTTDPNSEHGSPDGVAFDAAGRLYIQTDGRQPGGTNDQMLVADTATGEIKRFLTGVRGCEVTGWTQLDEGTILVNLQHPGNGDPGVSSWPSADGSGDVPRDACVVITQLA